MKKMLMKSLALAAVGSLMVAGSAMALPSFSFSGLSYDLLDTNSNGVSETLSLGFALVGLSTEGTSEVIGDAGLEFVTFSDFTLDEADLFNFNPTTYVDGFTLVDDDSSTVLMKADITLDQLNLSGTTATINPSLSLNLTDIDTSFGYVAGTSTVIDAIQAAWLNGAGGAVNVTLNMGENFANAINTGVIGSLGSYSGTVAPVPEPATMLLLGTGLVGLAGARRRKKAQK